MRYMLLMREAEVLMHENEPQRTRRGAAEATHGFSGETANYLLRRELLKAFKYFRIPSPSMRGRRPARARGSHEHPTQARASG